MKNINISKMLDYQSREKLKSLSKDDIAAYAKQEKTHITNLYLFLSMFFSCIGCIASFFSLFFVFC